MALGKTASYLRASETLSVTFGWRDVNAVSLSRHLRQYDLRSVSAVINYRIRWSALLVRGIFDLCRLAVPSDLPKFSVGSHGRR